MQRSSLRRPWQRPGLLAAVLFAATIGLAGALAYQAARAAASHRTAAEASLVHHATIAAWRFSREARGWLNYGMNQAGDLLQTDVAPRTTLPGPDLIRRLLAEKWCDCVTAAFGWTVFRVVNEREPTLLAEGETLSYGARAGLLTASLAAAADTAPRPGPRQWQMLPPGEPRLRRPTDVVLLWKVGDRKRGVRAVYGMVVDSAQITRPLRGALGDTQFFPPSLIPQRTADSLVRIAVAGPNQVTLFQTGPDTRSFVGTDTIGWISGNLKVTAAIDPAAARLLIDGGLPASRVPTIVALLALALAMGASALLLLRRENRLARLREDFVSGVSHELRTPLTQIRMLSELLQSDGFHSGEERERAVGVIHREALRLTNLVDNILAFARLRRPAAIRPPTPVALSEVAGELADSFAPLLDAQGDRLEIVLTQDLEVPGDRDAIARVLRNLLENAVKYGPAGQTIRLTVAGTEPPGAARVTIDDEGPGIPRAEWTRVWQPYYRLDRDRNAPGGGSGLGLSVVADLLRLLGGRAWIGDAPGRGTRLTVEFPGAIVHQDHRE